MIIESLELKNYRNYKELHMDLHPGTNVLYGDNAQGKTNLMEAVSYLSTVRSFRASQKKEMIAFGKEYARIRACIKAEGRDQETELIIREST